MLEPSDIDGMTDQYTKHLEDGQGGPRPTSIGLQNKRVDPLSRQSGDSAVPVVSSQCLDA
jgi:hypothetical protein